MSTNEYNGIPVSDNSAYTDNVRSCDIASNSTFNTGVSAYTAQRQFGSVGYHQHTGFGLSQKKRSNYYTLGDMSDCSEFMGETSTCYDARSQK